MNFIFSNSEIKNTAFKLFIFQVLFVLALGMFTKVELNNLQKSIVNSNEALVGNVLLKHPELEDDIIGFVTKEASQEDIKKGKEVLRTMDTVKAHLLNPNPILGVFIKLFSLSLQHLACYVSYHYASRSYMNTKAYLRV